MQLSIEHRLRLVRVHHMEAHTMVTRMPQLTPCGDASHPIVPTRIRVRARARARA